MTCPDDAELGRYLSQELDADRAAAVESHVGTCSRCQQFLDLLTRRNSPHILLRELATAPHAPVPAVPGFELGEPIGAGGMGRVWKARQLDAGGRVVAIKMLVGGPHAAPEWVARFRAEAETLAKLDHPNIVRLYTSGPAADGLFLAMEYLPAGSLADDRRADPDAWTAVRAARVVAAAARAVDHAHRHGVVHRDLKPANVLLTRDGEPKVADFGLARTLGTPGEYSRTGRALGTPVYMAPEQAAGDRHVGPPADVYGLGGVLYFLLTGLPPVPDDGSELDVLTRVRTDDPVTPRRLRPSVPRDLETICLKCLRKEPERRYESAAALADDLDRFLDGRAIRARPIGRAARTAKWVRRNPMPTAALVLLTVAAVAAGAFWRAEARAGRFEREAKDETIRRLEAEQNEVAERGERLRFAERVAVEAALRGNDPKNALARARAAEKGGVEITPEMRFLMIDALEAIGRANQAREQLEVTALPPEFTARRDLRLGDLLVGIDDARAQALIAKALADPTLQGADRTYALAARSATAAEALPLLDQALKLNPVHLPARRSRCLVLLCSGQLPDAIRAAEDGVLLYPQHPDFRWALFLACGFAGDGEKTRAALEGVKQLVPTELQRAFDDIATYLPLLGREFHAGAYGAPASEAYRHLAAIADENPAFKRLLGLPAEALAGRDDLLLRLPQSCREPLREFWDVIRASAAGRDRLAEIARDAGAIARFGEVAKVSPDGFLRFCYGMILFHHAVGYQAATPNDPNGFRERMARAGAEFESASKYHGLIDARTLALEKAIFCFTLAGKPAWAKEAKQAWVAKGNELLRQRLYRSGPIQPSDLAIFVKSARNAGDFLTARYVLDDWESRFPKDLGATRLRAEVEFLAKAYLPALQAAEKVLATNADDADMQAIAAQCRTQLAAKPSELAPPPRPVK